MLEHLKRKLEFKKDIFVHLFYEAENPGECESIKYNFELSEWDNSIINRLPNFFSIYPINVARNIARLKLSTRLFLSGDIEQLLSDGYEERVRSLAHDRLIR